MNPTRRYLLLLPVTLLLFLFVNCGSSSGWLASVQVNPSSASIPAVGGTAQFQAIGGYQAPVSGKDITSQVVWSSSVEGVATVSSSGLATAVGEGTTTITAAGGNGSVVGTATLTVGSGSAPSHTLTSLTIIPATGIQKVNLVGETAQYIAIGNFTGSPATEDLTDQVTWSSSDVRVATINSAGLATAVGSCALYFQQQTTVTALAPQSTGGAVTGTSDLTVGQCGVNNLPSLTVYNVGQGGGTVTSSPAGINCGSGGGCTGNFVLNSTVTLTAVPAVGDVFGGWSANCQPDTSATCTLTMTDNATVGAIFNLP